MKFKKYLKDNDLNPNSFSVKHNVSNATAWRAAQGKPLSYKNSKLFSGLVDGAVTVMEFLEPKQKSQRTQKNAHKSTLPEG